jgi:hypothetical protein
LRITFLTGSLEQGKDGVGDYTRLLAHECASRGVASQVIALADRYASHPESDSSATSLETLRLGYRSPWFARLASAGSRIRRWSPHWVSLQFVPYSFHRWGIATRLVNGMSELAGPAKLHAMLHEIWTGGSSWPQRVIGASQRHCVLKLCRQAGAVVHTSNETYQRILAEHAVNARVLPLFGSLPIADSDADAWLPAALVEAGFGDVTANRQYWWLVAIFGTLHPVWQPEPLMQRLRAAAEASGKRVALISIGRLGPGEDLWRDMQRNYAAQMPMLRLGEQPDTRISQLLNSVDFGIATSPYSLIGKSATIAAMLEHGVPVIVNREDGPAASPHDRDQNSYIRMDHRFEDRLAQARRGPRRRRLSEVADQFLADLTWAANAC